MSKFGPPKFNSSRAFTNFASAVVRNLLYQTYDTDIPTKIFLGFQPEIVSENFVLTARWTKSRRHTRMHRCVRLVDLVTASKAIGPDAAKLIELIQTAASDKE